MTPSIRLESISKAYGGTLALDSIDLHVDGPVCLGILGPNGAGKTTMLKIITNISRPTGGVALVNGINVSEDPQKALSSVGSLIEQPEFYPYLRGREILEFVAKVRGLEEREIAADIGKIAQRTGCAGYLDKKSGILSRGMKQRLGLAAALIGDPEILILDEPTFGLDPRGMRDIREIIRELSSERRRIIMLSTHLTYEASEICERVIIVNRGRIVHDTGLRQEAEEVKVVLEEAPANLELPPALSSNFSVEGSTVIIRKRDGVANSELISYLAARGMRIKYILPGDSVEDMYVRVVD
ncbi:MAG: ABC transporter ATP-binding protein [Candidatus Thermoplasmatota archaeon]|nr:ABC transporter ATP-binding protein [Candidatus Thermoplasmatota archaeon]